MYFTEVPKNVFNCYILIDIFPAFFSIECSFFMATSKVFPFSVFEIKPDCKMLIAFSASKSYVQ